MLAKRVLLQKQKKNAGKSEAGISLAGHVSSDSMLNFPVTPCPAALGLKSDSQQSGLSVLREEPSVCPTGLHQR